MNGPGGITSWPRVNNQLAPRVQRPVAPRELEARNMLAKLFGNNEPDPEPVVKAPVARPANDDEFAPNLGRHLDVTA